MAIRIGPDNQEVPELRQPLAHQRLFLGTLHGPAVV
jgi:hypothetical protein